MNNSGCLLTIKLNKIHQFNPKDLIQKLDHNQKVFFLKEVQEILIMYF